ncbi:MAG: ubiquitin-like small modifier protein 1 [Anaerolineae bacterium]
MAVVKLYANLRRIVNAKELDVPGANVREVVDQICAQYDGLGPALLEQGKLRPHVRVMVNGHDVELDQGLDTAIREQDEIAIFPPITGGSYRVLIN